MQAGSAPDPAGSPSSFERWRRPASWAVFVSVVLMIPAALFPSAPTVGGLTLSDKVVHFGLFFFVSRSWYLALAFDRRRPALWALAIGVLLGALLEVFQTVVGWRTGEVADAVANSLGSAAGVLWCRWRSGAPSR